MKASTEKQNITIENSLASLVLKRLHVHFTLSCGHRLKILDNGTNESETLVSVGYTRDGNRSGRPAPVGSTGQLGCQTGRDSLTGRSRRLKNWSNSPFWQLKTSKHQPKYTYIFYHK